MKNYILFILFISIKTFGSEITDFDFNQINETIKELKNMDKNFKNEFPFKNHLNLKSDYNLKNDFKFEIIKNKENKEQYEKTFTAFQELIKNNKSMFTMIFQHLDTLCSYKDRGRLFINFLPYMTEEDKIKYIFLLHEDYLCYILEDFPHLFLEWTIYDKFNLKIKEYLFDKRVTRPNMVYRIFKNLSINQIFTFLEKNNISIEDFFSKLTNNELFKDKIFLNKFLFYPGIREKIKNKKECYEVEKFLEELDRLENENKYFENNANLNYFLEKFKNKNQEEKDQENEINLKKYYIDKKIFNINNFIDQLKKYKIKMNKISNFNPKIIMKIDEEYFTINELSEEEITEKEIKKKNKEIIEHKKKLNKKLFSAFKTSIRFYNKDIFLCKKYKINFNREEIDFNYILNECKSNRKSEYFGNIFNEEAFDFQNKSHNEKILNKLKFFRDKEEEFLAKSNKKLKETIEKIIPFLDEKEKSQLNSPENHNFEKKMNFMISVLNEKLKEDNSSLEEINKNITFNQLIKNINIFFLITNSCIFLYFQKKNNIKNLNLKNFLTNKILLFKNNPLLFLKNNIHPIAFNALLIFHLNQKKKIHNSNTRKDSIFQKIEKLNEIKRTIS